MLSLPSQPRSAIGPARHWKTATAAEAVGSISSGVTIAVGWLSDVLATALADAFSATAQPSDLTIVYGVTHGDGRTHGLNLLAHEGLVRRVVGGQWHPVPRLQALATDNRIEAYSLPVGVINRLFRDIAEGLPGHLSRSGLGTFTDPRNGGGRLNRRTREQLVRLVRPAGDEALLFSGFPIDVAMIGVAFMEGTAAIAMTREAMTIARAARRGCGLVIAQMDRIGTLDKLPPGQVVVPDTLVDILVAADHQERNWATFSSPSGPNPGQRRLAY
jgi:propionate CoA-transferase